jgi:hypothetical protein
VFVEVRSPQAFHHYLKAHSSCSLLAIIGKHYNLLTLSRPLDNILDTRHTSSTYFIFTFAFSSCSKIQHIDAISTTQKPYSTDFNIFSPYYSSLLGNTLHQYDLISSIAVPDIQIASAPPYFIVVGYSRGIQPSTAAGRGSTSLH